MKTFSTVVLVLFAVLASGCGAARGIRVEASETPPDPVAAASGSAAIRVLSETPVSGLPFSLVSTGNTVWVSTSSPGVQALDARSGLLGGLIISPTRAELPPSIASSPGVLWILVRPEQGGSRLLHLPSRPTSGALFAATAGLASSSVLLPRDAVEYPRRTRIIGATRSALWLVSRSAGSYTLWRRDLRSAEVRRFPLASFGSPGLATGGNHVYVLLQTRAPRRVIVQVRDDDGTVASTSTPVRLQGTFEPTPLVACENRVFGWTRNAHGASLFALGAQGGRPRYSPRMAPRADPSKLVAIAPAHDCGSIWVSTVSHAAGVISRLRGATLTPSGQLDTAYLRGLLWTGGTLWATDLEHHAVLRIR